MIDLHFAKAVGQMEFERVDALEDAVVEGLLTQIIPEMLDRVEFR